MNRPHFAFLDNNCETKAFAHRGGDAAGAEKENSMTAFEAAYQLGYRYFETDVISTADGKVLATHGSKNEKAQQKTGLPLRAELEAMTYEEIEQSVRIGGEPIPLLDEVFATFPDARINIDAKTETVVKPLADLILGNDAVDRVCIASFSYKRTQSVAEMLGGQGRVCTSAGTLGFMAAKSMLPLTSRRYLQNTEAACIQVPLRIKDLQQRSHEAEDTDTLLTTPTTIFNAREAGLDVHVWTVNDAPSMRLAMDIGVDGIMSDNLADLQDTIDGWRPA